MTFCTLIDYVTGDSLTLTGVKNVRNLSNQHIICMYTDAKCILQSCPVSPLDLLDIKKLHLESEKEVTFIPGLSNLISENNNIGILESYNLQYCD